jgi:DNA-binding response OmpR family regulator
MSLLVLEDDPVLRKHLVRLLAREGFRVVSAASCAEALLQLAQTRFDIILLDVMLPDGSGLDLLAGLSQAERPLHALVMTAQATPENEAHARWLAVRCLLPKPLDLQDLLDAVRGAAAAC